MSGIGFSEFLILCMIGLIVLGPKRLPKVANQVGSWVGQARRMTRVMRRQLEEELNFDKELNIKPNISSVTQGLPNDDDSYSPLHDTPPKTVAGVDVGLEPDVDSDVDPGMDDSDEQTSADEAEAIEDDEEAGRGQRREV